MANIIDFYTDIDLKDIALSPPVGVAGITGSLTNLSNWDEIGSNTGSEKIYRKYINAQSGITLGGTGAIATLFSPENWVTGDTPKIIDGYTRNAFFINCVNVSSGEEPSYLGYVFYIDGTQFHDLENDKWIFTPYLGIGAYRAYPSNVISTKADRTSWQYYTPSDYELYAYIYSDGWDSNSQFNQICMYTCTIEEKAYFLFVLGANNGALHPTNTVPCMLIPRTYFKNNIPKPYVGPVSKESAESAFIGSRSKESVLPRDLSISPNPYGFNRNGVYLCKCDRDSYNRIIAQMYNGLSGNLLNLAGQVISSTIGGNARRPRDEIATMIDGVLCCQSVPVLGGYPSTGSVDLTSICGYSMYSVGEMLLQTVDPIQHETITTGVIPRQTGNYLDFAPYTTVTLTIPILGSVTIDPSAVLGRALSLHFGIDLFSGVLSCDISIIEPDGTLWIYTTLQGNAVTDMPIMGAGANANPLLKIANGAMGIASGNMSNVVGGIYSIYDGIQTANYAAPISRVSHTGANLLLSPYAIYLTVTAPNNSNAADFWSLAGIPSHMSGNVGSFTGYTVFEHVDLSGVSGATDSELSEIENTLRGGVWL